jgi:hypothetical protein
MYKIVKVIPLHSLANFQYVCNFSTLSDAESAVLPVDILDDIIYEEGDNPFKNSLVELLEEEEYKGVSYIYFYLV